MKPMLRGYKHHGKRRTPAWISWRSMRERCINKKSDHYKGYGAKGIKICDRWDHFQAFLADMGERPKGTTIDRIDNKGDYTPRNCRWATAKEQARNRKDNRIISYGGRSLPAAQWAEIIGIKRTAFDNRLNLLGWTEEQAITGIRVGKKPLKGVGKQSAP